jgi:hypothetical protein
MIAIVALIGCLLINYGLVLHWTVGLGMFLVVATLIPYPPQRAMMTVLPLMDTSKLPDATPPEEGKPTTTVPEIKGPQE